MARRESIECDKCGRFIGSFPTTVSVVVDHFTDAAGSSDTDQRTFDLCGTCCRHELQKLLSRLPLKEGKAFCEVITKKPFRDRFGRAPGRASWN